MYFTLVVCRSNPNTDGGANARYVCVAVPFAYLMNDTELWGAFLEDNVDHDDPTKVTATASGFSREKAEVQ